MTLPLPRELVRKTNDANPTIALMARAVVDDAFAKFKAELKAAGYTKLYVGEFPGETFLKGHTHLFATPPTRERRELGSWPAIWRIAQRYFETGCGNGPKRFDQRQLDYPLPPHLQGEHEL